MEKKIRGKVFVLGNDIDTDQIIPAEHLVYSLSDPEERNLYGRYALSGVPVAESGLPKGNIPFVPDGKDVSEYSIIVAGKNFGCGSSREHAPFALREAGVQAVVAEFYARIFFRNSVNGGYIVPCETPKRLVEAFETGQEAELDLEANTIKNVDTGESYALNPLGDILPILEAGDVFAYAKQENMLG
ncbi:MAG: 3-isopropylmalate dehydratase [Candidatus Sumerlaeia bacterium]